MSKSKPPRHPKPQHKVVPAAHRMSRPEIADEDHRPPRSKVQTIGVIILVLLVAVSMLVSAITPFFM